ncbi:MAG: hypothetical protein AB1861_22595 [Cyanobacteriota bacterium]
MMGNCQVRFLGEGRGVTLEPHPTGWRRSLERWVKRVKTALC